MENKPNNSSNIVNIECLHYGARGTDVTDLDSAGETAVIRVTDNNGEFGLGEIDAPPNIMAAILETKTAHAWSKGLKEILIGENPLDVERLWEKMYDGTIYYGRRGLGVMVIGAIDIALHDLRGKILKIPVFHLLGGAQRDNTTPYLTLFPGLPNNQSWPELKRTCLDQIDRALTMGFQALKIETLFDDLISDRELIDFTYECRRLIGDHIGMMIDTGYRWRYWNDALRFFQRIEDANLIFVEAPLRSDDLDGLAKLADSAVTPVAAGEFLQTRYEFRELIERGHCDVIQPDIGRVGGLTEALRCARLADERGLSCIPHAWKTGITVAVTRHFAAAVSNCPFVEYYHPDFFPSPLRSNLAGPEPELLDGKWSLPDQHPGMGVEMNHSWADEYSATRMATLKE